MAAVPVVAFSPSAKAWLTCEEGGSISIPNFDGEILAAPADRAAAADDWGHIISKTPMAVLVPGSPGDIRRAVNFANLNGIKIGPMSMVGNSHSTYGQSQADCGLVIDMSALAEIHEITPTSALVDAGVRWHELLQATLPYNRCPPTLTDHIDLSVGGTISVGGIGGQTFEHGLQCDNVLELWVVTGNGDRVHCSPTENADLFHSVRGGLGQFGIIVRARVRLIPIETHCRVYTAVYPTVAALMADQEKVLADGRFDYVEGQGFPQPDNSYALVIECVKRFTAGTPPSDAALTGDLSFIPGTLTVEDKPYFDFLNRLAPIVDFTKFTGEWYLPHPLMDMFVPKSEAAAFITSVLAQTPAADIGYGPVLIYPFRRSKINTRFVPLPDEPICYLLSLLRWAPSADPLVVADLVAKNRAVFEDGRDLGAKRYAIGSLEVTPADWEEHFGSKWCDFVEAKCDYDADNTLTPGQNIFDW